jgi:hypothetical protein
MARELKAQPKKLGGIENHRRSRGRARLPRYIERIFAETVERDRPDVATSIEAHRTGRGHKNAPTWPAGDLRLRT